MTKPLIGRKDTLAAGLCTVLLLALLGAVGTGGRERAKRVVCMMNVQRLTAAWLSYATDNDDRLVNGAAGIGYMPTHAGEKFWVGRCWAEPYNWPCPPAVQWPVAEQILSIKNGALWSHTGETKVYACPGGRFGEMVTYAIMDGVNGLARAGTYSGTAPREGPDGSLLWVKKWTQIARSGERLVFIDQGYATPDSFAVYWDSQYKWWDDPPTRHNGGTVVSFADGHVADHKWKGRVTASYGSVVSWKPPLPQPWSSGDWEDLHFVHNGCWGQTHPSFPWRPGDD